MIKAVTFDCWNTLILENGGLSAKLKACIRGILVKSLISLSDEEIDAVIANILERGGRIKIVYGADGKKITYYQVNATFFSALGEEESKLRLARAIQMFMPGIPQVWYLDLFAGKNDYVAADKGGTGGHKEINRTTLFNKMKKYSLLELY